ncbi:MAG TPA: hypothetical protein VJV03_02215 [Pyrinomonadaceae bacterium]|nr:hypothetical protein [Pyrinomonadaceae bacterium]
MQRKIFSATLLLVSVISLMPVQAQSPETPCVPGISFWNLLDSVSVGYVSGRLSIDRVYAPCLPAPAKQSTSNYAYDPDVGGKLTTVLKTADGKALSTYVWYASQIGSLWELSRYKIIGGHQSVQPLTAGSYVLEFAANDKPFYRFPFTVTEGKNEDPYQPAGARYFVEGAWNEYGNIFYQRNAPESVLKFTTWVQDKSGKPTTTLTPYDLKLVSLKDGKVVGEDSGAYKLEPRWQKADMLLRPAGADKNTYLRAGDFLKTDGRYAFRLTLDGKPYGTYPFEVKGGRIQLQGRQIREKTDPMIAIVDYLSGGRYTSWWIKKE